MNQSNGVNIEAQEAFIRKLHTEVFGVLIDENGDKYKKLEKFRFLMDQKPEKEFVKEHPWIKGALYIPISHIEGLMDTFFFRQWGTRNFRSERIENEMVSSMDLWYFDPVTEREITRVGVAAFQIPVLHLENEEREEMDQKELNGYAIDIDFNKKANGLESVYAIMKEYCFKNACKSIGRIFGKDLNRDIVHIPVQILVDNLDSIKKALEDERIS